MSLYLVTDSAIAAGADLVKVVLDAVRGGVTMVQLREKNSSTKDFLHLALRLRSALSGTDVPLIINDRIDIALACEADGVHIGQSDMPYGYARKLLGPDKIIGLSVENLAQVENANSLDVDYIGVSPVFATTTKTDTATPFGLDSLERAVRMSVHPVVAIGGINSSTAAEVMRCGADGIAVVSAIIASQDPCGAARRLKEIIQ